MCNLDTFLDESLKTSKIKVSQVWLVLGLWGQGCPRPLSLACFRLTWHSPVLSVCKFPLSKRTSVLLDQGPAWWPHLNLATSSKVLSLSEVLFQVLRVEPAHRNFEGTQVDPWLTLDPWICLCVTTFGGHPGVAISTASGLISPRRKTFISRNLGAPPRSAFRPFHFDLREWPLPEKWPFALNFHCLAYLLVKNTISHTGSGVLYLTLRGGWDPSNLS
jgi:hypothetical protein